MIRFDLGDRRLSVLDAGTLWLDGGAMFGVVPRALWSREREPDERNRIELAMNVVLVEDGKTRSLVDTGAGTDWDEKSRAIYRLDARSPEDLLKPAGLVPGDIDRVIVSHLHFDHAGGNTVRGEDGEPRAAYPNAEYVVQDGEIEFARLDNERVRASYVPGHFEPLLAEAGRVRRVRGDVAIAPGIRGVLAPGHTPHMQMVLVEGGGRTVAFPADLVPTASHVRYPYVMGFDVEPLATLATKKRVLPSAVRGGWTVVFEHDRRIPAATLIEEEGRIVPRPVEGD